jgi:hypothetical protein
MTIELVSLMDMNGVSGAAISAGDGLDPWEWLSIRNETDQVKW